MYRVTKLFIGGALKGYTSTEVTNIKMPIGFRCSRPIGGSPYIIISCVRI